MTDYRELSEWKKKKVDEMIVAEIEPGEHINKHNNFKWTEPDSTLREVHNGEKCAECLMIYYNCLCSHN